MSEELWAEVGILSRMLQARDRRAERLEARVAELERSLDALERKVYQLPEDVALVRPLIRLAEPAKETAAGGTK